LITRDLHDLSFQPLHAIGRFQHGNNEFDGASISFGERVWSLINKKVPEMDLLLNGCTKIKEIRYLDRYLCSPLTILLLHNLLSELVNFSVLEENTSLLIQTAKLGYSNINSPLKIYHDWIDGNDRKMIV
jgi:hypothetical protein